MSASKGGGDGGNTSNVFAELNAQDEVASMMEDDEVMDQLEEIGREQRGNDNSPTDSGQEVQMGPPTELQSKTKTKNKPAGSANNHNFEALLDDDSLEGGIVQGAEESFDFNPPVAVSAHAAATGFDAEFNESIVVTQTD